MTAANANIQKGAKDRLNDLDTLNKRLADFGASLLIYSKQLSDNDKMELRAFEEMKLEKFRKKSKVSFGIERRDLNAPTAAEEKKI